MLPQSDVSFGANTEIAPVNPSTEDAGATEQEQDMLDRMIDEALDADPEASDDPEDLTDDNDPSDDNTVDDSIAF